MDIAAALNAASSRLSEPDIPEHRREASGLLALTLQQPQVFLIAHPEYELTTAEQGKFEAFITRRVNREPCHYITGHKEFFGLDFEVTPDVLIPRPETEILVEAAIEILRKCDNPNFCEIGVGSGCISISILHVIENASGIGVDVAENALTVARRNAEKHLVKERLNLKQADILSGVTGTFDLIVSNPPYIPLGDITTLQVDVRDFEPRIALNGGTSGLDLIGRIIRESPEHLVTQGVLLMEIGFGQFEKVCELFDKAAWNPPDFLPDLQGIPRIVKAQASS